MNLWRGVGGGRSPHFKKRTYWRSPGASDALTCRRGSGDTPASSRYTTRCTRCSLDVRTREPPVTSKLFPSCTPRVTQCPSAPSLSLRAINYTRGSLGILQWLSALVFPVTLLFSLLVITAHVSNPNDLRLSTSATIRILPRTALQPVFALAITADEFPAGRSGISSSVYVSKARVQSSFGGIPRVRNSLRQDTAPLPQAHDFAMHVASAIMPENGRRLASSSAKEQNDDDSKDISRAPSPTPPPAAPSTAPVLDRFRGDDNNRRDSAPEVNAGTLSMEPSSGSQSAVTLPSSEDEDSPASVRRTRRCASFSSLSPRPKTQASPTHYPVPFHGHAIPHSKRLKNALPWDIMSPVSPSLSTSGPKGCFPRETTPSHSGPQFHALLHDKPHSLGEALWSDVSATEKSAFDETEKRKSSSAGKASGNRLRPDLFEVAQDDGGGGFRRRTTSWTEEGDRSKVRRMRSSPGQKKRRHPMSEEEKRLELIRGYPRRPPVAGLFSPLGPASSSGDEAPLSPSSSGDSSHIPTSSTSPVGPRSPAPSPFGWPKSPHSSEVSSVAGEDADKTKKPFATGDSDPKSADNTIPVASEESPRSKNDDDDDDDGSDAPSSDSQSGTDPPHDSEDSDASQDHDDDHDVGHSSPRFRSPSGECDRVGDDTNRCPAAIINLMFDVYYHYLTEDPRLRRQYALLVLSFIQWPLYTDFASWRRPQLQKWFSQLIDLANETRLRETDYAYSNILLDELMNLGWILRSVDDFERFLRSQSIVDVHLRQMLSYVPEHRLAISLKPQLLEEVYNAVAQLQFIYYYSSAMKNPEASALLQWKFIREVHLRWSMLQLLGITHQLITRKPLSGLLILQVDKVDTKEQEVLRLFDAEENKKTQEALLKFETTVTDALTRRIQMVAKHFQKIFSVSDINYGRGFQLPKCQVTAFYLKRENRKEETTTGVVQAANDSSNPTGSGDVVPGPSEAIETGLFGFEIDLNIAKELKDRLPPGSMYIQLSLVDGWDYQPVYNPPLEDPTIIPAHRATQILKANLEHDPSLFNVGITKVIYSTILDSYNTASPDENGFDNDRHLVLRVPLQEFRSEEHFLVSIVAMVSVPSIHNAAPRTVNASRIKVMGSARRLSQGEVLKSNNFLSGIDYRRHKSIEAMIEPNTIAVHMFIEGIKEKTSNVGFEMTGSTIFDRLLRRGRSKFSLMHAEVVPKKPGPSGQEMVMSHRLGGYPAWVLVLSNLCVAAFFLVVLVSLLLNRHAKLPWWIACICGPQNPFAPESENRRDSVTDHADPITSITDRRAMLLAHSRSMLVPALGARKVEKWEEDQQTKSTDDGAGVESDSENQAATAYSRRSSLIRQSFKKRSLAAAALSRKGSVFFNNVGRGGSQGRQQTKHLGYAAPDELDNASDRPAISSTVPALSAVPACGASMDRSASADPSIRGNRSTSVCTQDGNVRENTRGSTVTIHPFHDKSLPPASERRPHGRHAMGQNIAGSTAAPAPLRTLELAKSYRRECRPPSAPRTYIQPQGGSGRRSSVSFKRATVTNSPGCHRDKTPMQRRKARATEERRSQHGLVHNEITGNDADQTQPGARKVSSGPPASPTPMLGDGSCDVSTPSGRAGGLGRDIV